MYYRASDMHFSTIPNMALTRAIVIIPLSVLKKLYFLIKKQQL